MSRAATSSRAASAASPATSGARRPPAVLRCDADLLVTDMNPAAGQVLSRRREEVVGHPLSHHLDEPDRREVERIRGRLITRGVKVDAIDVRSTGRSGDVRVVTLTFTWLPQTAPTPTPAGGDPEGGDPHGRSTDAGEGSTAGPTDAGSPHPGEFVIMLSPSDADPAAAKSEFRNLRSASAAKDCILRHRHLFIGFVVEIEGPAATRVVAHDAFED